LKWLKQNIWLIIVILAFVVYLSYEGGFIKKLTNKKEWCEEKIEDLQVYIFSLEEENKRIKDGIAFMKQFKPFLLKYYQATDLYQHVYYMFGDDFVKKESQKKFDAKLKFLKTELQKNKEIIEKEKKELSEIEKYCGYR